MHNDIRLSLQITILVALFAMCGITAAQSLTCEACRKPISGRYTVYSTGAEQHVFCDACDEQLPHCAVCSIPVVSASTGSGDILCRDCRKTARYCAVCNTRITGAYFTSQDQLHVYCATCVETAPRCDACSDILRPGGHRQVDGHTLCTRCDQALPRCHACGKVILDTSVTFNNLPERYCASCAANRPHCVSCGRPCEPDAKELRGGNMLCNLCRPSAMLEEKSMLVLAHEVREHLRTHLLMPIVRPIEIVMVDTLGTFEDPSFRESGRFIQTGERFRIEILRGLSWEKCLETLAHELGHAWQAENLPGIRDSESREGFAQWTASKVLENYGLTHLIRQIEERDDLYGKGYRAMIALEQRLGIEGMFKSLRKRSGAS